MNRLRLAVVLAAFLAVGLLSAPVALAAAAQAQNDPVTQCAEGVQRFNTALTGASLSTSAIASSNAC